MTEQRKRMGAMTALLIAAALKVGQSLARFFRRPPEKRTRELDTAKAGCAAIRVDPSLAERPRERDKDLVEGGNTQARDRWGTLLVTCASIVGIASGIGFVYVYWAGSSNVVLLGEALALSCGALGFSLIVWARLLMPHKEATEGRELMESSPAERQRLLADFDQGKHDVKRRSLLTWMSAGFAAVFAASAVSLVRSLGTPPGPSLYATIWKPGQRLMSADGTPVSVDALEPGSTMLVFPEDSIGDEKAQTVLVRVDEQFLPMPRERADWAPAGYLAYSRICTHAGCPVGLYQKQTHLLLCPCHQSSFDVLKGAEPTGGPATRALPQLPLYVDAEGILRAGGGFSTPPGPGFWGMPA